MLLVRGHKGLGVYIRHSLVSVSRRIVDIIRSCISLKLQVDVIPNTERFSHPERSWNGTSHDVKLTSLSSLHLVFIYLSIGIRRVFICFCVCLRLIICNSLPFVKPIAFQREFVGLVIHDLEYGRPVEREQFLFGFQGYLS